MKLLSDKALFFIALLVLAVLPLLALSFYNHPCNDDFWETNIVFDKGLWHTLGYYYNYWSGRYFCLFLISLNPLVYHAYWAYKLNTVFAIILLFVAMYWLIGSFSERLTIKQKLAFTAILVFAYFERMPDIREGLFWQSGAYCLHAGNVLSVLLMASLIRFLRTNSKIYFITVCLLLFATIGCYEVHLIYVDFLVTLILGYSIFMGKINWYALIFLVLAIAFSLFSITAPGNAVREMEYPAKHQLLFSIKESFKQGIIYSYHWGILIILVAFILFDLLYNTLSVDKIAASLFKLHPIIAALICFAVPVIGFFPGYWAEGQILPDRAINVVYFFTLISAMYFWGCCICTYRKRSGKEVRLFVALPYIAYAVLIFITVARPNNINVAYADLTSGKATDYNAKMEERNTYLSNNKSDSCSVPAVTIMPKSFCFVEIPNDTADWRYKAFCKYYHKKFIAIK